jgi:hypothetical protein
LIWQTLKGGLDIEWRAFSAPVLALVALQLLLFAGFILHGALAGRPEATWPLAVIPILSVLSLPSQFVAWSTVATGVEIIFYMYCLMAAALAFVVEAIVTAISEGVE